MDYKNDILDLRMRVVRETPHAILVCEDCQDSSKAVWLPLSQIEYEPATACCVAHRRVDVQIPGWLAEEKGLV